MIILTIILFILILLFTVFFSLDNEEKEVDQSTKDYDKELDLP